MRIVLFSTPSYFYEQSQGVPRLVGYLKKRGHDVVQRNLNYEYFKTVCTPEWLLRVYEETPNKDVFAPFFEVDGREMFFERVAAASRKLDEHYLELPYTTFREATSTVQTGLDYLSAAYPQVAISLSHGIKMRESYYSSKTLLTLIQDPRNNPIRAYYEACVVPWLLKEVPDIVGISMTHMNQFLPGFALCHLLKQQGGIHCIIGGMAVTHLAQFLCRQKTMRYLFDSIALGAGEYTLEMLLSEFKNVRAWKHIPNFMYKKGGLFWESRVTRRLDPDDAETPEYIEPRPRPIIALETSQNCYWGKCAFCHWPKMDAHAYTKTVHLYKERSVQKVLEDLSALNVTYNPFYIRFTDAAVLPRRLDTILRRMRDRGQHMHYYAYIRAEAEFKELDFCASLKKNGLIGAICGLETGSQRINDLYGKGTSLADVSCILGHFKEVGIVANLFCIVLFPQESVRDLLETAIFLRAHARKIGGAIHVAPFALLFNAPAYHQPKQFGIYGIRPERGDDLPLGFTYKVKGEKENKRKREIAEWIVKRYSTFTDKFIFEVVKSDQT